ncbi:MAG: hypothetical protein CBC13_05750 [Planctomycetia bacterium TMED53]|nr:MAG: hypothetical protein CBC13_05750 [Planctomycetia bacterium TMED53]
MFSRFSIFFVMLFCVISISGVQAQDPTFSFTAADQSVPAAAGSASFSLDFNLIQTSGLIEDTRGFSFSCAHDPALLAVVQTGTGTFEPETLGPLNSLNGGTGPDFIQGEIFPNGFTCGVIYAFINVSQTISYDVPQPVIRANYETLPGVLDGLTEDLTTQITQGSGLGSPETATVVVIGAGSSAPATLETSNVTILLDPPLSFTCRADDAAANFNGASGEGTAEVGISVFENILPGGAASDTQGFSLGLSYDNTVLNATGVSQGATLQALEQGQGAEFFEVSLVATGLTVGVIYDFQGQSLIPYATPDQVLNIAFDTVAANLAGTAPGEIIQATLTPTEGLGPTGVTLVMVVGGRSVSMTSESGVLSLTSLGGFDRGNCNADGQFDLADVIKLLGGLFTGDPLSCLDACDANNDALLDIADAIRMLGVLFSGDPPMDGAGTCAPDSDAASLGCDSFPPCE